MNGTMRRIVDACSGVPGLWAVRAEPGGPALKDYLTRAEALKAAADDLRNSPGGGELFVYNQLGVPEFSQKHSYLPMAPEPTGDTAAGAESIFRPFAEQLPRPAPHTPITPRPLATRPSVGDTTPKPGIRSAAEVQENGRGQATNRNLTAQEKESLVLAPFVVFYIVGYADGKLSRAESNTFASVLKRAASLWPELPTIQVIMEEAHNRFEYNLQRLNTLTGEGLTLDTMLSRAKSSADRCLSRDEALTYKQLLLRIGEIVADAWPLVGRSTSDKERSTLANLRRVLGV